VFCKNRVTVKVTAFFRRNSVLACFGYRNHCRISLNSISSTDSLNYTKSFTFDFSVGNFGFVVHLLFIKALLLS